MLCRPLAWRFPRCAPWTVDVSPAASGIRGDLLLVHLHHRRVGRRAVWLCPRGLDSHPGVFQRLHRFVRGGLVRGFVFIVEWSRRIVLPREAFVFSVVFQNWFMDHFILLLEKFTMWQQIGSKCEKKYFFPLPIFEWMQDKSKLSSSVSGASWNNSKFENKNKNNMNFDVHREFGMRAVCEA